MNKEFFSTIYSTLIASTLLVAVFSGCSGASSTMTQDTALTEQLAADPSTVAIYDNKSLNLEEFERRYARSVGGRMEAAGDSLSDYADFLDRYLDFRIKVLHAEDLGLNNDSTIQAEIESYRNQLARPFLLERDIMEPILLDLYEKKQNMVDASHILARVGMAGSPEDTLLAYNKMLAIVDSLEQGIDFGELAYRNSDDPSARGNRIGAKGRLGYFMGGQMVKAFEDRAYSTPAGSHSPIFRSEFGYHILFVHDRRARVPDVWASHIATRPSIKSLEDTTSAEGRIQKSMTGYSKVKTSLSWQRNFPKTLKQRHAAVNLAG